ncbi:aminoglycoside adenylyltransferase family protein [Halomonas sp. LR3S48]|uniref:aminoglycoside adenylyltransferase family protein n=1 Tax=Halomonas sp. LR3S48 TaxID=2982694 RepID=UPI0021E37CD6|nr:aminoglycoside adenylyltransferase family protein [Halomonas sp. LR3S48]UYG04526.1 aminoglycoside adenylyltransferase family protein [Halomonas sp. LR3S48]
MKHSFQATGQSLPEEAKAACDIIARELGESVVGVYLFGSALRGGLRPNSDVDVLAVISQPPDDPVRRRLVEALMAVSGSPANDGSPRPLEVTLLCRESLVPWRYPPRSELVYGEWLRDEFAQGRVPPGATDPDLALVLATARQASLALCGPELAELVAPIPEADLRRAIVDSLPGLIDGLHGDERNVLLTLARMWMTVETGEIAPKDVAAAWALERLPAELQTEMALARHAYLDGDGNDWPQRMPQVEALAGFLRRAISCASTGVMD